MANIQLRSVQFPARQRLCLLLGITTLCLFSSVKPAASQASEEGSSQRKVLTRVEPDYPETLKRLYIGGAVRVEVVVAPAGTVESAQLLGGNPILGQAAMKAVKRWKYAPASAKEKLVVKFDFDPHN